MLFCGGVVRIRRDPRQHFYVQRVCGLSVECENELLAETSSVKAEARLLNLGCGHPLSVEELALLGVRDRVEKLEGVWVVSLVQVLIDELSGDYDLKYLELKLGALWIGQSSHVIAVLHDLIIQLSQP